MVEDAQLAAWGLLNVGGSTGVALKATLALPVGVAE
jgi:hypothetical protein